MTVDLVHDDWSWAAITQALTKVGITYRTEWPWHAEGLGRVIRAGRRSSQKEVGLQIRMANL